MNIPKKIFIIFTSCMILGIILDLIGFKRISFAFTITAFLLLYFIYCIRSDTN